MIDRFGNKICVGYSEIEIIWLEAANTLLAYDRSQALYDISEMTGRSVANVRDKANELRQKALDEKWLASSRSPVTAGGGRGPKPGTPTPWLRALSKEAMMARKAKTKSARNIQSDPPEAEAD